VLLINSPTEQNIHCFM